MTRIALAVLVTIGLAGCADRAGPPMEADAQPPADVDVDNTGVNVRDRDAATKTPIDQNEDPKDVNITAEIRSRVVDADLSLNAENVKIITQKGHVTLRGPVKSQEERDKIMDIATDVAGTGHVENQLEVEATP